MKKNSWQTKKLDFNIKDTNVSKLKCGHEFHSICIETCVNIKIIVLYVGLTSERYVIILLIANLLIFLVCPA